MSYRDILAAKMILIDRAGARVNWSTSQLAPDTTHQSRRHTVCIHSKESPTCLQRHTHHPTVSSFPCSYRQQSVDCRRSRTTAPMSGWCRISRLKLYSIEHFSFSRGDIW